jgi:hypothetical protein
MRRSILSELRMLREFAHEQMPQMKCCFCKLPLLESGSERFGERNHKPIRVKLTVHHKDGNHSNNAPKNRKWSHRLCHHKFHVKLMKRTGGKFAVTNGNLAKKLAKQAARKSGTDVCACECNHDPACVQCRKGIHVSKDGGYTFRERKVKCSKKA